MKTKEIEKWENLAILKDTLTQEPYNACQIFVNTHSYKFLKIFKRRFDKKKKNPFPRFRKK